MGEGVSSGGLLFQLMSGMGTSLTALDPNIPTVWLPRNWTKQ